MKESWLARIITNNGKYKPDNPDFRRVVMLNTILLCIITICLVFSILDVLYLKKYYVLLINSMPGVICIAIFVYFHKTENIKVSAYATVVIIILAIGTFLYFAQNRNFSFCWLATLPPVVYFLLGIKRARIILSAFFAYILFFILFSMDKWSPAEFTYHSLFNIIGATVALIHVIGNFEKSRNEAASALMQANAVSEDNRNELKLILDSAAEGIMGIDTDGKCTFCNARCLAILGYKSEEELIGKDIHGLVQHSSRDGKELPLSECRIIKAVKSGEEAHSDDEVFWRSDNTCFDVMYYSYPKYKNCKCAGAVVTFLDISERKRDEKRISYMSRHDSMTDLMNRSSFEEEIVRIDKDEYLPISIIYGDLNGLKLTNDIFGHAAGDDLIKQAAGVLKRICRRNDIVARIAGDEFIWLLPHTDSEAARKVVERVKSELAQEEDVAIKCSMAIGTDTKWNTEQDIKDILLNTENKMYLEKTMLRKNYEEETVHELIAKLHSRCPREKEHSEITAELCARMGQAMVWSEANIRKINDAGYYHDIGKIVLSDALLNKTEKLTPQENSEKRQHVIVGYRILNLFDQTLDLAEAVYYHHERWDGSGYPKGLKGEEIPVESRIIALAEQYGQLTDPVNEYRVSREAALEHISKLSGEKFDPQLTLTFINLFKAHSARD